MYNVWFHISVFLESRATFQCRLSCRLAVFLSGWANFTHSAPSRTGNKHISQNKSTVSQPVAEGLFPLTVFTWKTHVTMLFLPLYKPSPTLLSLYLSLSQGSVLSSSSLSLFTTTQRVFICLLAFSFDLFFSFTQQKNLYLNYKKQSVHVQMKKRLIWMMATILYIPLYIRMYFM